MTKFATCKKIFISTFSLSLFTFGGGYVIVPLMKKKFVNNLKWIDEEEMLNLIAVAQSSPGPIAVNTSIMIGYKVAGFIGAAIALLGTILPPFIILSIISLFYSAFKSSPLIKAVLNTMRIGVAAVIIDVVIGLIEITLKEKKIVYILIMILSFIGVYFLKINLIFIILAAGFIGYLMTLKKGDE